MMSVLVMQLGLILSVGIIRFEDRFCTSTKGGIGEVSVFQHGVLYTWQLAWLHGYRKAFISSIEQTALPL